MQQNLFQRLQPAISPERLHTYLVASGFDEDRALSLYLWNARIGETFHLAIQGAEVALRNAVNHALCNRFGADWWRARVFMQQCEQKRIDDISTCRKRLVSTRQPECTSQIVATLSFGFWVALLHKRYHPTIWSYALRKSFPTLPKEKTHKHLHDVAHGVLKLRNRIWHHEPIFKLSLNEEYSKGISLISWICPTKSEWIQSNSHVLECIRQKP